MPKETKKCPYCAEDINIDAVKCRYCGEFLNIEKTKDLQIKPQQESKSDKNYDSELCYVKCESCGLNLIGNYYSDIWGFHKYKCTKCGFVSTYPFSSFYEIVYWIFAILFGIWLFVYLFVDQTASLGCLGLLGLFGIPILIYNSKLKSAHPNCKVEEFNSQKGKL